MAKAKSPEARENIGSALNAYKRIIVGFLILLIFSPFLVAQWIIVPMDESQTNHLKAYGLTYWTLEAPREYSAKWLLNYRGGAFLLLDAPDVRKQSYEMGVNFELLSNVDYITIQTEIENSNMDEISLEKAPKIAVYRPHDDSPYRDPWDDAVKIVMDYADIPYETVWDEEVMKGALLAKEYDWLHLHHEDFTGQYGKFYASFRDQVWYQQRVRIYQDVAQKSGFDNVARQKGHIAELIRDYIVKGGFLFAMCSAPETLDIALATDSGRIDIVAPEIDGTPVKINYQSQLKFDQTFTFKDFELYPDPNRYEFSNIDNPQPELNPLSGIEDFILFEFAAKHDPIPAMLTQNHKARIFGYLGQTTSFNKNTIRQSTTILGEIEGTKYAKYIHGNLGKGTFTFLAGHDPEDYRHLVGEGRIPTNLNLHKHSPGYRLILNNILFPAAKKKPQKT